MADQKQDWAPVTWSKGPATRSQAKDKNAVANAVRRGEEVETTKRFSMGNKAANSLASSDTRKLDEETENFRHAHVSHEFKTALQQARQAKGLTQAQLAQMCSEKATVINEYESGKAIPKGEIINKLNRALGVRLPKAKEGGAAPKPKAKAGFAAH